MILVEYLPSEGRLPCQEHGFLGQQTPVTAECSMEKKEERKERRAAHKLIE
jgi:hypothetical protein